MIPTGPTQRLNSINSLTDISPYMTDSSQGGESAFFAFSAKMLTTGCLSRANICSYFWQLEGSGGRHKDADDRAFRNLATPCTHAT